MSPTSLAGTAEAKALKAEAEATFGALPDQLTTLSGAFASRSDDLYVPTNLAGSDGDDVRAAVAAFLSADRGATRFYVTAASDPYSGDALQVLRDARSTIAGDARAFGPAASGHVVGPTIQFADVQDTLAADFVHVGIITVLGILLVLIVLLRAIVAPLYLVATVLVSYGSTLGISGFLFQEVLGQPGVSPYLGLIVFVLLVALGSDYNIFLMHRVREESEHRPIRDGVRIASGHTGAVITSAGLILAGTFASMATASLVMMFQVGIAVAIGVLIDTFLVRSILVPAITTVVGDRAWWPSGAGFGDLLRRLPQVPEPGSGTGVGAAGLAMSSAGRGRRPRLAPAVAIGLAVLIPVFVAGLLTWSFGSASDDLRAMPAAVVNLDEGGSVPNVDGTPRLLALGSDLSAALTAGTDQGFTWTAVDASDASSGLADGRYAAVLTIPADFSRSVAAIRTDPTGTAPKATLEVATADGSGDAMGTIAQAVTAAIGTATAQDITASYVDDVLMRTAVARTALTDAATEAGGIAEDGSGLADAAAGAGTVATSVSSGLRELADGASSATSGTGQLVDGMRQLSDGTASLATGATRLATGTTTAAGGARDLSDGASSLAKGLDRLSAELEPLPDQASQLAAGADGVADGAGDLADGADQLAAGLDLMATGSTGMGDGAKQLDTGAASLEQGARDLRGGADQAASGAASLASGAASLSQGVDQYTGGVDALAANCAAMGGGAAVCDQLAALAAGSSGLRSGAAGVQAGAADLRTGVDQLASGMDGIVSGANGVHTGTSQLADSLPALEQGIADASSGATKLASGAGALSGGARQVADGTQQLADGMPALRDGVDQLASGAGSLSDGLGTYADGMRRLADGSTVLASGVKQTASGARRLAGGTASAVGGIGELTDALASAADGAALVEAQVQRLADDGSTLADRADGLAGTLDTSADGVPTTDPTTRDRLGSLAADPVTIDATHAQPAATASTGYAPTFMAIAAWLGVLGALLVVPAVRREADERRWWRAVAVPFAGAAAVAILGTLLMVLVLDLVVGMGVAELPALVGIAVLVALAFTAVVQALVVLFGTRGWLAALLLLVLGVAASGLGTDPSVVPWPLAMLRPLLPTTYAIDAFAVTISGVGSLAADIVALTAFLSWACSCHWPPSRHGRGGCSGRSPPDRHRAGGWVCCVACHAIRTSPTRSTCTRSCCCAARPMRPPCPRPSLTTCRHSIWPIGPSCGGPGCWWSTARSTSSPTSACVGSRSSRAAWMRHGA